MPYVKYIAYLFIGYIVWINLIAVIVTCYDKSAAKHHKRRVRENTLLLIGAVGGFPMMYLTMKLIRHKTLHLKFMIGLPLIFILEVATVAFVLYYLYNVNML